MLVQNYGEFLVAGKD